MTDPLAEIKARPYATIMQWQKDRDWLLGEIERLRGLLGRLEWAQHGGPETLVPCCPACGQLRDGGHHLADCWLTDALHPTDDPPEGERP